MRKLFSALLTTLYPTPCLVCKAPLPFSFEVLCQTCLKELSFDQEKKFCPPFLEKMIIVLSQDRIAFELLSHLKRNPSRKLIRWVASLIILRIAKEGEEPFFDSLFAFPEEVAACQLAKQVAKMLSLPFIEGGKTLFISLDEGVLSRLEKQRKDSPHKIAYLLQLC